MTAIAGRRQGDGRRPVSALPILAFTRKELKELSGMLGNPLHVDPLVCSRPRVLSRGTSSGRDGAPRLRACTPGGCEPADRGDLR